MKRASLLLAVALLLGGCATVGPPVVDQDAAAQKWRQHYAEVAALTHFALTGRAASGAMGAKADLRWQQFEDGRFEARVSGPFGAGAAAISGTAGLVEIRTKDGVVRTADPEGWMQQQAGWTFPIRGLSWWARGLPAPDAPAVTTFDADGRLATLVQDGWTFQYSEYQDVQGIALPRRFQAASDRITLKLIVDRWDSLPPRAS
ncbi:lipoprotein insertase outer membrane protein LolB [Solimonas soli]|uniref:lipoprotein insertase outer membrane protein LolB n=1 Tax=Solimonas soli TaxID=413479 RepID=UPI0004851467|nr:lipoprotein insertase outer membrane protein LolB [Solimonas soli]